MKISFKICIAVLIFNVTLMKCEEISNKEIVSETDVLLSQIKGLERVKISLEIINRRYLHQLNDLKNVVTTCHGSFTAPELTQCNEHVCEEIISNSNETLAKYALFHDKFLRKLSEIHNTHTRNLEPAFKAIDLESHCQNFIPDSKKTYTDNLLFFVEEKMKKIENDLSEFEYLEEQFNLQQNKSHNRNENLMKSLLEIKEKLQRNEEKFEKFRRELPDLHNFSNKISNLANWKQWKYRNIPPRQ